MSGDPSNGDANGGGQVALLSDPVDVIIDKLLREEKHRFIGYFDAIRPVLWPSSPS